MKEYLDSLKAIWFVSFIASVLALVVVCLYIFSPIAKIEYDPSFIRIAYAIQIIVVVLSLFLNRRYRSKIQALKNKNDINDKLVAYKKIYKQTISFSTLLFLVSLVVLFFSNSAEFIIISVALLLLLFLKRPYRTKLKIELSLNN